MTRFFQSSPLLCCALAVVSSKKVDHMAGKPAKISRQWIQSLTRTITRQVAMNNGKNKTLRFWLTSKHVLCHRQSKSTTEVLKSASTLLYHREFPKLPPIKISGAHPYTDSKLYEAVSLTPAWSHYWSFPASIPQQIRGSGTS